ncbi:asparagine N-glycosylation enzyme membrane subunit Stt3 [Natronospira proteinivora]|uniref:Asparagine N-glycosylation enzyme membrane subunit Stt3 n=1 Tax=Natronospira proteinivora TaxID=1807133 RepID=A0ABT1G9F6_9GAMM|nr:twin transmembrane helix small protein [Natronospira proteinivora]MCP1727948.1 asparagine N-glycosylation enzyme membrane subunit Stt3 [Natronospira proteinivora]
MRLLILLMILAILASLASAMFYLLKDGGHSKRTVWALTLRVGVSIGLFMLLWLGYALGILQPSGPPVG